jgi:hypothetical protein
LASDTAPPPPADSTPRSSNSGAGPAHLQSAERAARLLAYGLQARLRPGGEPEYAELIQCYESDGDFRTLVAAVAAGLRLEVLEAGEFGLALGAESDSLFAYRLRDYRATTSVEDRLLHGLVHLAAASYCYPSARDLDERASVKRISVGALELYLREVCERLAEQRGESDPREDQPETEQAWRIYHRRNATRESPAGRTHHKSTQGIVRHALEFLAEQGFLRKLSDDEGGTFQVLARYRIQVRELAAHEGYRMLCQAGGLLGSEAGRQAESPAGGLAGPLAPPSETR